MTTRILSHLFLGDTTDAIRFGFPMEGIQGTLDLTGWDAEKEIYRDDFTTVNEAIQIIDSYISKNRSLLVFCHASMDRSPFIVACYLYRYFEHTPKTAYEYVKQEHAQTIIHDDWMKRYQSSIQKLSFIRQRG